MRPAEPIVRSIPPTEPIQVNLPSSPVIEAYSDSQEINVPSGLLLQDGREEDD